MVKEDFRHLAQCCQSLLGCIDHGDANHLHRTFNKDEFDRFIDRLVWAIQASPDGSPDFNHRTFITRCNGLFVEEEEVPNG